MHAAQPLHRWWRAQTQRPQAAPEQTEMKVLINRTIAVLVLLVFHIITQRNHQRQRIVKMQPTHATQLLTLLLILYRALPQEYNRIVVLTINVLIIRPECKTESLATLANMQQPLALGE